MIKGPQDLIEKSRAAGPMDKTVFINFEALDQLPEQFEAVVSSVRFNKAKLEDDFTNVGTQSKPSWFPKTQLMYDIATARGISGMGSSKVEPIYETVDFNAMLCVDMIEEPRMRNMKVGVSVTKQSYIIEDDGTKRPGSPCTSSFNVWERCSTMWSKEDEESDGKQILDGKFKIGNYDNYGPHFKNKYGKFQAIKYNTKFKRKAHFDSEMKHAQSKAETKAYTKSIRELGCMPTGYTTEDLKDGQFVFAKIQKSSSALKLEQVAALKGLSEGKELDNSIDMLGFSSEEKDVTPEIITPEQTPEEKMLDDIKRLLSIVKDSAVKEQLNGLAGWLSDKPEAHKDSNWQMALDRIKNAETVAAQ